MYRAKDTQGLSAIAQGGNLLKLGNDIPLNFSIAQKNPLVFERVVENQILYQVKNTERFDTQTHIVPLNLIVLHNQKTLSQLPNGTYEIVFLATNQSHYAEVLVGSNVIKLYSQDIFSVKISNGNATESNVRHFNSEKTAILVDSQVREIVAETQTQIQQIAQAPNIQHFSYETIADTEEIEFPIVVSFQNNNFLLFQKDKRVHNFRLAFTSETTRFQFLQTVLAGEKFDLFVW